MIESMRARLAAKKVRDKHKNEIKEACQEELKDFANCMRNENAFSSLWNCNYAIKKYNECYKRHLNLNEEDSEVRQMLSKVRS